MLCAKANITLDEWIEEMEKVTKEEIVKWLKRLN